MKRILPFGAAALLSLALVGCGSSHSDSMTTGTAPSAMIAATSNPLVASYTITQAKPGNVTIEYGVDTTYGKMTSAQHTPAGGGTVTVLVAGMKASTTYHMRALMEYDNGTKETIADRTFATGAIPSASIPAFTVATTPGLTPQPGVELVDMLGAATPGPFVSDLEGNVIWTYSFVNGTPASSLYPIKLLANGHFMCLIAPPSSGVAFSGPPPATALNTMREFDLAGTTVRELTMAQLNSELAAANFNVTLQVFSHDFAELPNGHFLVIANTIKSFDSLPGYPGTANVVGDVVVDLDENLKPVWLWNEFDHLDVNRRPMNFPDWTHSNSVTYSPDDGNFLISIRHQNWVVKVDYRDGGGSGDVLWKLGQGGDFKLQDGVDPTDWFFAQHDANFVSTNTTGSFKLAIMDNGDDRTFPADVACGSAGAPACFYTTVAVMQVDENAKTASFVFHQELPSTEYSSFAGGARVLSNSNVEYNLAGAPSGALVFEVTPTATPETVWQMSLKGSNTYRVIRIPSLYPGVQW